MDWLKRTLSESNGTPSSIRIGLFLVILAVVGVTVYSIVRHTLDHTPWDIGTGLSNLLAATVASLSAAKAWQKGSESGKPGE